MALCYNFTRVLNILGFERFVAEMTKALSSRKRLRGAVREVLQRILEPFWTQIVPGSPTD